MSLTVAESEGAIALLKHLPEGWLPDLRTRLLDAVATQDDPEVVAHEAHVVQWTMDNVAEALARLLTAIEKDVEPYAKALKAIDAGLAKAKRRAT